MKYLDRQIVDARENYNYFFIKLFYSILKNVFKLSVILILNSVFDFIIINIMSVIYFIYCFFNIILISKYYLEIIKDIKDTVGYKEFSFEINIDLLHDNIFRGMEKYGK